MSLWGLGHLHCPLRWLCGCSWPGTEPVCVAPGHPPHVRSLSGEASSLEGPARGEPQSKAAGPRPCSRAWIVRVSRLQGKIQSPDWEFLRRGPWDSEALKRLREILENAQSCGRSRGRRRADGAPHRGAGALRACGRSETPARVPVSRHDAQRSAAQHNLAARRSATQHSANPVTGPGRSPGPAPAFRSRREVSARGSAWRPS